MFIFLIVSVTFASFAKEERGIAGRGIIPDISYARVIEAMNHTEFQAILALYMSQKEADLEWKTEMQGAYLGQVIQIPVYDGAAGELIDNQDVWYCPIVNDNEVLAVIRFTLAEDQVFYVFSTMYAVEMTEAALAHAGLFFEEGELLLNKEATGIDYLERSPLFTHPLSEMVNNTSVQGVVATAHGYYISGVPHVYQGYGTNYCWAAAICSTVRYKLPSTYGSLGLSTVVAQGNAVAAIHGGSPGLLENMYYTTAYYLSPAYLVGYTTTWLTSTAIKAHISNNCPIIMICYPNGNTSITGHVVTVVGYEEIYPSFAFRFLNPSNSAGTIDMGNYSSIGPYKYTSGGTVYVWYGSIMMN